MYATRKTAVSKLLAIAMAIAMALTMTVSAFASDVQPYYDSETTIAGKVNVSSKTFTVTVQGPSSVTKVKMEATLYQKKLIGREEHNVGQLQQCQMLQEPECSDRKGQDLCDRSDCAGVFRRRMGYH